MSRLSGVELGIVQGILGRLFGAGADAVKNAD